MSQRGGKRRKTEVVRNADGAVKTFGTQSGNQHEPKEKKKTSENNGEKALTIMSSFCVICSEPCWPYCFLVLRFCAIMMQW